MITEKKAKDTVGSLREKTHRFLQNSLFPAISGMSLIVLALICFIISLWVIMAIVRLIAGLTM